MLSAFSVALFPRGCGDRWRVRPRSDLELVANDAARGPNSGVTHPTKTPRPVFLVAEDLQYTTTRFESPQEHIPDRHLRPDLPLRPILSVANADAVGKARMQMILTDLGSNLPTTASP